MEVDKGSDKKSRPLAPLDMSAWVTKGGFLAYAVILLPAHPASFAHNFVSGMQSICFSESQYAIV